MKEFVIDGKRRVDIETFSQLTGLSRGHIRDLCGGSAKIRPVLGDATIRIGRRWLIDVDHALIILASKPAVMRDTFDDLAGL